MSSISAINYLNEKTGKTYGRLLVLPTIRTEYVADNGLIIPEDAGKICEEGVVFAHVVGSVFKTGDSVLYRKVERINKDEYESVIIEDVEYDAISEAEVWSVNEKPHNRLFVEPISNISISEDEIIVPEEVKGVPQKGIVISTGFNSLFFPGDVIEYRKQEHGIYPTVCVDGHTMDVLFENDVFTVNDEAAPHRIIVKIDISEQSLKRNTTATGIALSPLFQFMLRNLQYGEVVGIGNEAQLKFPDLGVGDTAILHHIIESQPYRFLRSEKGSYDNTLYEYRVINTQDVHSREIFGKIERRRLFGRINDTNIIPFEKNIFLKWDFDTWENKTESKSVFIDMDFELTNAHNLDDFRELVEQRKAQSVKRYNLKLGSLVNQLKQLDPTDKIQKERGDLIESQIAEIKRDILKKSAYINQNHLLKCKQVFPKQINNEALVPYRELYPINLFGQKYLIANTDLITAYIMNDKVTPYGVRVLVLPIEDEKESLVEIPDSAREKPQRGKVIGVGPKVDEDIVAGDIVLYKRLAGTDVVINGVVHLMLFQNDLLGKVLEAEVQTSI